MKQLVSLLTIMLTCFSSLWSETTAWRNGPETFTTFSELVICSENNCKIDISHISDGLILVAGTSDRLLKIEVEKDEDSVCYAIPSNGSPTPLSLTFGDGQYTISFMERIESIHYQRIWSYTIDVAILSPFAPYLHPNVYVPYKSTDLCVRRASELADMSGSQLAFIRNVEQYVRHAVSYDYDFVPGALDTHRIDPDATLKAGEGVCIDQAALVAAMLRSQGVPAKLIFGNAYHGREIVYHAWVEAWNGQSWVLIDTCMPRSVYPSIHYKPTQYN